MKIGYFDCIGGAGGDMILAAMIDAGLAPKSLENELAGLPIKGWKLKVFKTKKGGISATGVEVIADKRLQPATLKEINKILNKSRLPKPDIASAKIIFRRLAAAEAKIHGVDINRVRFHEIGAVDTIIDVVGAICGIRLLNLGEIIVSALPMGRGIIRGEHGALPLPAPATLELLKNFQIYEVEEAGETVTPTAAAILSAVAVGTKSLPAVQVETVGYGAGTAEFKTRPNLLRLIIAETENGYEKEFLTLLETNIDDANPQVFDLAGQRLFDKGALDVWISPIQMKKNRPAVTLSVLCRRPDEEKMAAVIFEEGLTLGIRRQTVGRISLPRSIRTVTTKYGKVRIKTAAFNQKIVRAAPEYEDCKKIALQKRIPFSQVIGEVRKQIGSLTQGHL